MNKTILAIALLVGSASAGSAMAADVSSPSNYTFVEVGATATDSDFGIGADGGYLRGSYEFGQTGFYVAGKATRVEVDGTNFDVNQYDLGVGYHRAIGSRVDGFVEASAIHVDADGGFDADGYRVSAGTKIDVARNVEGVIQINHYDGHDFASDTTVGVGAKYNFTQNWAATAGAEFADAGKNFNLGVRYSF